MTEQSKACDAFISHASEDKETFVRPLACTLAALGVSVWYDEFSLRVGDSLSRSIDRGLAESKHGVVVITPAFMAKRWPEFELRALMTRQVYEGGRIVLPLWHNVTREQVFKFSARLADTIAIDTSNMRPEDVAIQLLHEIRPDLYDAKPRSEFEKALEAHRNQISALRDRLSRIQLKDAREELARYSCPFCGARSLGTMRVPICEGRVGYDVLERFGCGLVRIRDNRGSSVPSLSVRPFLSQIRGVRTALSA